MLQVYNFIQELQNRIGNGASVTVSIRDDNLVILVDWIKDDFHAERKVRGEFLESVKDSTLPRDFIIDSFKYLYRLRTQ